MAVGLTAGMSSMAHALSVATTMSAHIATRAPMHSSEVQKAVEVVTDPANMSFLQNHPVVALTGYSVIFASACIGLVAAVAYGLKDSSKENESPSIGERISSLRNRFITSDKPSSLKL